MDPDIQASLSMVGARLRAVRLERDVTLAELSAATGISPSTLSRLESGQRRPNLELLLPLARAHGVPLDELVGAPAIGDPKIHLRPYKAWGRTIVPLSNRTEGIQAFKQIVPAVRRQEKPQLKTHDGFEWVYVIEGQLRLIVGEVDLILVAGEAAEFDTRVPHWSGSADGSLVEYLCLFSKQGERVHLQARPRPRRAASGPS